MTAVAGLVGLDGRPFGTRDLSDALRILAPLGRDGEGRWAGRLGPMAVALGARRRLRVPEDDADDQPVTVGPVTVVADIVLTNRPELCRQLDVPPDLCDAAIVAHAYLTWGEACCARLRGDFAIAVADRRRGGVLLARDHIGARPLHVHQGCGWLGFATTALAVTGFEGVRRTVDLERAKEFLALQMASERSWVRDVTPVPPATMWWITPDGIRRRRYWNPVTRPARRGSADAYAEELRSVFDDAVRARLRHRGGIGVLLSGGLDSTAVAATVAAEVAPEPVRTYTSVPPPGWTALPGWTGPARERDPDESPLVRLLAARYPNLVPAFVDARGAHVVDGDPELFAAGCTPVRNTVNMTWIRKANQCASDDKISVLFTGAGGNQAFSRDGKNWLLELLALGRWPEAWREARAWSAQDGTTMPATLRRWVAAEAAPDRLLRWWTRRGGHQDPPGAVRDVGVPGLPVRYGTLETIAGAAAQAENIVAREARWGWRHADPTVDVDLLEVCLRQPAWARRRRGVDRAAARAAMRGRLPDEIRLRRVRGAQLPDWYDRVTDAYAEICAELAAAHDHGPSRALIDLDRLDRTVSRWVARECAQSEVPRVAVRMVLPRALAVSRYLRWFDGWAAEFPRTAVPPGVPCFNESEMSN